jgi:hypothetical protein
MCVGIVFVYTVHSKTIVEVRLAGHLCISRILTCFDMTEYAYAVLVLYCFYIPYTPH